MRRFALLFVLIAPALSACGAAWASTPASNGKPVCTQYDDKPAARSAGAASAATASATPTAPTTVTPTSGGAPSAQAKSGSTSVIHDRSSPHWQTLLPGMFR